MSQPQQPIIILGMHRSGTTMVTQMLEELGLFVGDKKDDNHESLFFYKINKWAFRVGTSKVDMPTNMLLMTEGCKQEVVGGFRYYLSSRKRKEFLGGKYFNKYKSIEQLDFPWGWKEPQNTFTIDLWKEIFPQAKVIHIYRHPLDTAVSFIKRDAIKRNRFKLTWKKRLKLFFMVAYKYHQNFTITNLEQGYRVWTAYVEKALHVEEAFKGRCISIQYEAFLASPEPYLKALADFCQLNVSETQIKQTASGIQESRRYAFLNDDACKKYYEQIKKDPLLVQLGYNEIV
ncbi:MAG: sulfotransferase [Chitinophagales bacterium]|nr:sulfotransferase [Chitinophagales bacterium]